jgi:uncharacterized membrane protein YfcA
MTTCILAGVIFFFAGFLQGLTGFGSALLAIPLLTLLMDIKAAVPLCMLNGLALTCYLSLHLRTHLDPKKILPLLVGSLPGIVAGASLLARVDSHLLRMAIGLLLITFTLYRLLMRPRPLRLAGWWGYIAGFFTGAIGAALSAGGPPAIIYTTLTGWNKEEIRATLSGFFVISGLITVVVHALTGVSTLATLSCFFLTVPFVLMGTICGSRMSGRFSQEAYLRLVHYLLLGMGLMMIRS